MKLYELKPGDEFVFVNLNIKGRGPSKFDRSVLGKRFRLERQNEKIQRSYVTGLEAGVMHYVDDICYNDYKVELLSAKPLMSKVPAFSSSFAIPDELGDIEFLRHHPEILKKMIEYSKSGNLDPFISDATADDGGEGMSWKRTPEGMEFWTTVLKHRNPEHFYTVYPRSSTPVASSTSSSKPTYNGTEQKVPRPSPAIRTGKRADGRTVRGKTGRTAIICGHLSHRAVSGS